MLDALLPRAASPIVVVVAFGLAMIAIERIRPGRHWPRVAGWWPRALSLNACQARVRHRLFTRPPAACPVLPVALRARFDG
jgi:hypothetical protein